MQKFLEHYDPITMITLLFRVLLCIFLTNCNWNDNVRTEIQYIVDSIIIV